MMSVSVKRPGNVDRIDADRARVRVWIDIDNPPQVQYLLPFRAAFEAAGVETVITARDYGRTVEMLAGAGAHAHVLGTHVGRSKLRKGAAVLVRAHKQVRLFGRLGRPDVLLAASRSAAIAAWRMGIPSFIVGDYEHVHHAVYRFTGSKILHPHVIDQSHYLEHGVRNEQLVSFTGIKEDITFAGVDVDEVEAYELGDVPTGAVKVLFRPPSETSHYYNERSTAMARAALEWLAEAGAALVFAPRLPAQVALLDGLAWRYPPVILDRSVAFVSLLKSVDAVVCAGGTMLREAAYLGIPAYSIFCSEIGAVDRWLEEIGRVKLLDSPRDLPQIELRKRGSCERLDSNPNLLGQLVDVILAAGRDRVARNSRMAPEIQSISS
jgi:uncharacterized protein